MDIGNAGVGKYDGVDAGKCSFRLEAVEVECVEVVGYKDEVR